MIEAVKEGKDHFLIDQLIKNKSENHSEQKTNKNESIDSRLIEAVKEGKDHMIINQLIGKSKSKSNSKSTKTVVIPIENETKSRLIEAAKKGDHTTITQLIETTKPTKFVKKKEIECVNPSKIVHIDILRGQILQLRAQIQREMSVKGADIQRIKRLNEEYKLLTSAH